MSSNALSIMGALLIQIQQKNWILFVAMIILTIGIPSGHIGFCLNKGPSQFPIC